MLRRAQQAELYLQKLKDPNLPTGLAAAMRDAFGVDSQSTINACFAVTFGGLETSASVLANMVRLLAANPGSLQKVRYCFETGLLHVGSSQRYRQCSAFLGAYVAILATLQKVCDMACIRCCCC